MWTNEGFRDHTVYKGHQIFLYKRAQIFAADLWGAFKGQGYGEFSDASSITMFADYIVPAVLQQLGVLRYSSSLTSTIEKQSEVWSGSEEEVELRACSVYAVEKMRELLSKISGKQVCFTCLSITSSLLFQFFISLLRASHEILLFYLWNIWDLLFFVFRFWVWNWIFGYGLLVRVAHLFRIIGHFLYTIDGSHNAVNFGFLSSFSVG